MTGTQFLAEIGFGQDAVTPASFPEYPPHNTKLHELEKRVPADSPSVHAVYQLLLYARQLHGQANFAEETKVLAQADLILDQLVASTQAGVVTKALFATVVVLILGALAYMYWPQIERVTRVNPPKSGKAKRPFPAWLKNRKRRGRGRPKAKPRAQPKDDDDDGEDDGEEDERDDA